MARPLILITNDDGFDARGITALIDAIRPMGDIVVIAPDGPRSAQSMALTINTPLRIWKLLDEEGLSIYKCNGTPCDCVKMGLYSVLERKPDLVLSGINHGTNSSVNVLYSGTMGAVLDACATGITAVGFSLCSWDHSADMSEAARIAAIVTRKVIEEGLPPFVCLNVNVPAIEKVKGIRIGRQSHGRWHDEYLKRTDPIGRDYYWFTGSFEPLDKDADDTDEAALAAGYASVVPCRVDWTDFEMVEKLKNWELNG